MRDLQQLFSADLLAFKVAHILLEAVVQPWTHKTEKANETLIRQTKNPDRFETVQLTTGGAAWLKVNKRQL